MVTEAPAFVDSVRELLEREGKLINTDGKFLIMDNCEGMNSPEYKVLGDLGIVAQLRKVGGLISRSGCASNVLLSIDTDDLQVDSGERLKQANSRCKVRLEWFSGRGVDDVSAIEVVFDGHTISVKSDAYIDDDIAGINLPIGTIDKDELEREMLKAFRRPIGSGVFAIDADFDN